jgi:hypothetical protein
MIKIETNSVFFGEKGLTSTSAQHIKDMAGHLVDNAKSKLSNINFVTEDVTLIGSNTQHRLRTGLNGEETQNINNLLLEVAQAQSLQAWLGEALKEKENIVAHVRSFTFDKYCTANNLFFNYPCRPVRMSQQEWLNSLNIKERNEYLHLQTLCAVYGNLIHPKGGLDNARKAAYEAQEAPVTYFENGGNTIFHHYTLSQSIEEIEALFFELQNTHREYQARFNAMKHKYELEADAKLDAELKEWEKVTLEMREEEKKHKEEYLKYKEELMIEARNLKIVIPNDLKDIYAKVSSLGK